jgi:hypothetical protein
MMGRLSAGLGEVAWQTGRAVRVGMQPEPGCVLDATDQIIEALQRVDRDRVGICLDLANLACTWEEPADALDRLTAAGISVIRVQLAAAVEVADPVAAAEALRGYVEPGHQHQVTNPAGAYVDDLTAALEDMPPGPWRIRYHVPLHGRTDPPALPTTGMWRGALRHLMGGDLPGTEYLDVEANAWAPGRRPSDPAALADGIAAELAYTKGELADLGLSPPAEACTVVH